MTAQGNKFLHCRHALSFAHQQIAKLLNGVTMDMMALVIASQFNIRLTRHRWLVRANPKEEITIKILTSKITELTLTSGVM